jgi:hypothetical protein
VQPSSVSSTPSSTPTSVQNNNDGTRLETNAVPIIGGAFGGFLGLIGLVGLLWFLMCVCPESACVPSYYLVARADDAANAGVTHTKMKMIFSPHRVRKTAMDGLDWTQT